MLLLFLFFGRCARTLFVLFVVGSSSPVSHFEPVRPLASSQLALVARYRICMVGGVCCCSSFLRFETLCLFFGSWVFGFLVFWFIVCSFTAVDASSRRPGYFFYR